MSSHITNLFLGVIAGILSIFLLYQFKLVRNFVRRVIGLPIRIAFVLVEGGIQRFTLSRADYHRYRSGSGTLRAYLATAKNSIDIVSISLNVTQAEGALISLFEQKINENDNFMVRVSLLSPISPVVPILAKSLDIEPRELLGEIKDTLGQLLKCKKTLPTHAKNRLLVFTHETLPIGSAILLDATPESGRIQVETKLYRAPRTESFGFEVIGPSPFYSRNFTAWQKVFLDSTEWFGTAAMNKNGRTKSVNK